MLLKKGCLIPCILRSTDDGVQAVSVVASLLEPLQGLLGCETRLCALNSKSRRDLLMLERRNSHSNVVPMLNLH